MLEELRITGLGVIAAADVNLSPGLTVVTGETGAGKTMVMSGLGLLFGGRADSTLVRPGHDRATVDGRLRLAPDSPALARAVAAGAALDDDGSLLVHRSLSAEGRSRCTVGGVGVPVSVLADLAADVVAVHGQADQQRLVRPAVQRAALDRYGGDATGALLADYRACFERLRLVERDLAALSEQSRSAAADAEELRDGLARVEALAPLPDEQQSLVEQIERMGHAEELRAAAAGAYLALAGDPEDMTERPDLQSILAGAAKSLHAVGDHDAELAGAADKLLELAHVAADLATDLGSYLRALAADPVELGAAQDRLAALTRLTERLSCGGEGLLEWATQAQERLADMDDGEGRRATLTTERDQLRRDLEKRARLLRAARTDAGGRFAEALAAELSALAMPAAKLHVSVTEAEPGPDGADDVSLLLAAHVGAPLLALGRGASGGELSRVMLAVEVVFSDADPVPTMVFDEVDAGVGGQAAVEVGRRLSRLARHHQVIVVTHLPQVAAFADSHVRVTKGGADGVTATDVKQVTGADRVRELSRMLAGLADSSSAQAHAEELLEVAAAERDRLVRNARP